MNVGSLFSGVGGLDLGLARAGWGHVFFCESDEWRRGVLAERFPGVPIYDDVGRVGRSSSEPGGNTAQANLRRDQGVSATVGGTGAWAWGSNHPDLLCGGFPCQDLSVAGRRRGLAGTRSSLFFEFARIADTLRPDLLLVENVPGLLSSNGGRDYGILLGTLADIGYGVGWRILDSRFFGVPQRRRRVFIVGVLAHGDPARAAERAGEILAVGEGCDRHLAKGGEAGTDSAVASLSGLGTGGPDDNDGQGGRLIANTLKGHNGKGGSGISPEDTFIAAPLSHGSNPNSNMAGRCREDDENLVSFDAEYSNQGALGDTQAVLTRKLRRAVSSPAQGVRRLTPIECERLQALPDNWTQVPATAPDSRRYAALGDAVTASVAEWIGHRLAHHLRRLEHGQIAAKSVPRGDATA